MAGMAARSELEGNGLPGKIRTASPVMIFLLELLGSLPGPAKAFASLPIRGAG